MQLAEVLGHAVATVKHPSLVGWRLLLVQPLTVDRQPDGEPMLAIDGLGAWPGCEVIVSNDGAGAREIIGHKNSPVRWMVLGIRDPLTSPLPSEKKGEGTTSPLPSGERGRG